MGLVNTKKRSPKDLDPEVKALIREQPPLPLSDHLLLMESLTG